MEKNEIAVMGDEDVALGFRLAGVQKVIVASEEKLAEQLEEVKDATMLVMTEQVAEMLQKKDLLKKVTGTIIQIPDKKGSKGLAKQKLADLFESAIGVKLKR